MSVRYPWEPLEVLLDRQLGQVRHANGQIVGPNDVRRAEVLGCHPTAIRKWRRQGLTLERAESTAGAIGYVPYEIWPELLDDLIASQERECAAEDCEQRFLPYRPQNIYCSRRCKARVERRRYRARPEAKERKRESNRRYYEECRDYLRAKQSEYDALHREEINARRRARRREAGLDRLQARVLQAPEPAHLSLVTPQNESQPQHTIEATREVA